MSKIIGIDLGTTNSCFSIMEGGEATVISNSEGNRTTPSVVAIKDGNRLVGTPAQRQAVTNPKGTIYSAKRFIGHKFEEIEKEAKAMPFDVTKNNKGEASISFDGEDKRPEEISAMVLQKIKADAEAFAGQAITEAVITVPAYFNDAQRQATKDAGTIAGLNVKRIINEPTAAALAYGLDKKKDEKVVVYDLGGGTFDVSILEISSDGTFEVLSTNGDTHLGGDDFDQVLIDHLAKTFQSTEGVDLSKDPMAMQRLKDEAEKAKKELSSSAEVNVNIPYVTADASGPKHLNITITRSEYEKMISTMVENSLKPCQQAIKDAGISKDDINEVLLVGGSTRTPLVQQKVEEFFGKKSHKGVNPDEVVAMGAAIQAGILMGDVKDVLLLDVTPLTLAIETMGGIATPIIERNTTIPAKKSQVYSTAVDNQPSVDIHVTQGEREMSADNKSLGRFILNGIAPAPRGIPQIEITFDIDANGILKVTAEDKGTGAIENITIQGSSSLSDEEVEKMRKDAEAHADEDKKKRAGAEARNTLDSSIFQASKTLDELSDKLSDETKDSITKELEKATEVLAKEDATPEDMEAANKELMEAMQKSGEEIYKAQQEAGSTESSETSSDDSDAKVVDAEVVEDDKKDEDKK
ncbi:MAG: molecular chaperone DnaK [Patescibacteria group bacterium]|nr:molecular chaperone DnaK [Patescibacteria group bacterium]